MLGQETDATRDGPVVQSISIGFRVLYAAIVVLAGVWGASNWRQVPADSQAVVLRFGRIVGVQPAGLTVSWPRPVGEVALLPGGARQLTVRTVSTARLDALQSVYTDANGVAVPEGSGSYLTSDGGVVLLAAAITYQVRDAPAYYLARGHVEAALRRMFEACAVGIAAGRPLDDFLVTKMDADADAVGATANRRLAMRGDVVAAMNARLRELAKRGVGLGVEVSRVDLDATLPPAAKLAFDGVLVATQLSEQTIAGARTEAARVLQAADRERDHVLAMAHASADERVGEARVRTAGVAAIEVSLSGASLSGAARPAVLDQIYREQLAGVLHKVGRVTAVDPNGARVILPATTGGAP